jgi:HEAT repeat protein
MTTPEAERQLKSRELADRVRALIANGDVDVNSAVQLIRAAADVGASWSAVEDVMIEIAKGRDGVAGTADDLIPESTVNLLKVLLHSGVVRDIAAWAAEGLSGVVDGATGCGRWWVRWWRALF